MFKIKRALAGLSAAGLAAFVSANASAAGLADLAAGIDTADITAGLTAIALLIAGILAARLGIRKVLSMIK
ncbi:hypothetical protein D9M68_328030 [compost metagenome]